MVDPSESNYSWIDEEFYGYLISDSPDYIETARKLDSSSDTCIVFLDRNTSNAVYTEECSLEGELLVSESLLNEDNGVKFDSVYEYVYGINALSSIEYIDEMSFSRYNEVSLARS